MPRGLGHGVNISDVHNTIFVMLRVPFALLTYGCTKGARLFSISHLERHVVPMFTDAELAHRYAESINRLLDDKVMVQVCTEKKHALQLLVACSMAADDLHGVILDPDAPGSDGSSVQIVPSVFSLPVAVNWFNDVSNGENAGSSHS
jgi:hypothetical protein